MKNPTRKDEGDESFSIGFLVHDVSRLRRVFFDNQMKPLGITRSQWWVLAQLSRKLGKDNDEGVLQTELANYLDVGKVAVGGLIDRLEVAGFVERRPDAKDRRAKRVVITSEGREVLKKMTKVGKKLNAIIFKDVAEEDVQIARLVLAKIKSNILENLNKSRDDPGL